MTKLTANPTAAAGQTLEELKTELGRLSTYTTELGTTREAATAAQRAATDVVALVGQLGELQRSQLTALKQANETALTTQQQALARLAETWGQQWREEAARSLTVLNGAATTVQQAAQVPQEAAELLGRTTREFVEEQQAHQQAIAAQQQRALHTQQVALEKQFSDWLAQLTQSQEALQTRMRAASDDFVAATKTQGATLDNLISRQQQLATELTAFRDAMKQAIRFAEALEAVKAQTAAMEAAVTKSAAAVNASLQRVETAIKQQGATLHEARQQDAATQAAAFKQLTATAQQQQQQLRTDLADLLPNFATLGQAISQAQERATAGAQRLLDRLAVQDSAHEEAQQALLNRLTAHDEALKEARKEARIWQALTLLAALGAIAASLLRP